MFTYREKWEKDRFGKRLQSLREQIYDLSARKMSLDMGHHKNYINSIEIGNNYPTMEGFFEICDYLQLEPGGYFSEKADEDAVYTVILELVKQLSPMELHLLLEDLRAYLAR